MVSFCCCCCRLQVVPFLRGTAWEQPPPDLASFLYKNRIVYLGMCLVPSVTELMLAECRRVSPIIFRDAGPACVRGPCPEGNKACGHPRSP